MSLPSTFKFTIYDTDETFIAKEIDGNRFQICTKDGGELYSTPIEDVAKFVGKGSWKIVGDSVNHPSHYQGKTEVIDIIEQATTDLNGFHAYCLGNVIKYVMRHQKKGGITDLKKAAWYLNKVIGGESE